MNKPLCFVLMPFGQKVDAVGNTLDFDVIYRQIIEPAINQAGLEPLRADEEMTGGIINKPMFERLILCEYAVADLSTANPNVFYELGLRHAVRPWSTVLIFAEGGRLPFDVSLLRALPYHLTADGVPATAETDARALADRLANSKNAATDSSRPWTDSPLYELVQDYPNVDHTKTDVFRDRVDYSAEIKKRLTEARKQGAEAVRKIESELGTLKDAESAVLIDLFLSYRAVKAWDDMIALVTKLPKPVAATVLVQEQYALALNRAGRGDEAETVLLELIEHRGPSSETLGILGRIYKDRWEQAVKQEDEWLARALLDKAINTYLRGFEADWRDAYPGINAVTLMELQEPPDPRRGKLLPVVSYAVEQRLAKGKPDYWDFATLLELAVLAKDEKRSNELAGEALASVRESWEPETTARNLRLIREARERLFESQPWMIEIEKALTEKAQKVSQQ